MSDDEAEGLLESHRRFRASAMRNLEEAEAEAERLRGQLADAAKKAGEYAHWARQEIDIRDGQLKVATDRAQRFRDALLRVAARIDSWSYQDVWACVADALGVTVIELGQLLGE